MTRTLFLDLMVGSMIFLTGYKSTTDQKENYESKSREITVIDNRSTSLIGIKWILVELHGQVVEKNAKCKEAPFLQLNKDDKASVYAGCNKLFANYELYSGSHIRFRGIASTRMACQDMKTELVLIQVLQVVDSYTLKGEKMTLNKAGTVLARFVSEKK